MSEINGIHGVPEMHTVKNRAQLHPNSIAFNQHATYTYQTLYIPGLGKLSYLAI